MADHHLAITNMPAAHHLARQSPVPKASVPILHLGHLIRDLMVHHPAISNIIHLRHLLLDIIHMAHLRLAICPMALHLVATLEIHMVGTHTCKGVLLKGVVAHLPWTPCDVTWENLLEMHEIYGSYHQAPADHVAEAQHLHPEPLVQFCGSNLKHHRHLMFLAQYLIMSHLPPIIAVHHQSCTVQVKALLVHIQENIHPQKSLTTMIVNDYIKVVPPCKEVAHRGAGLSPAMAISRPKK